MTLMRNVESVAEAMANLLGYDWEALPEDRKKLFRMQSFRTYEGTRDALVSGMDAAADVIRDAIEDPSTPQNRIKGLTMALQMIIAEADEIDEAGLSQVPDAVPQRLDEQDEHPDIQAEMSDPYAAQRPMTQACGEMHPSGWTCTRPQHPPHWKHFDSDPSITDEFVPNVIHAVWDSEGDLLSVRQLSTVQDDDEED